ncbi:MULTISPECIES: hypothetical protein [Haloarcula]|uniref:DUF7968 domain-containing protein n=1 Tax=Haloarcula pellucida TaxID=1427151 RepID=A0A830GIE3_9EURY|nr:MULTISPECIES: hypothetical protein [Halomicroarcula]MBX0347405.1 hypothetical protein [Halomicroarcula pellucida]MDS0276720.1 hypothetical protein [Halomicroarcula sp. S1AR25-4]GGN88494.1 hypothetical protein GCM10009030_08300 [Halomicroarcula pellucida]
MDDDADVVTLTYRSTGSADVASSLRDETFQRYLRRSKEGPVSAGEKWDEVVNDGCGTTTDVTLTVARVSGGGAIGGATQFEFIPATES